MHLRVLATSSLLAALLSSTGCRFLFPSDDDGSDGGPCENDVFGCENNDTFMLDPSCTLEGDLELVLGQGETEFSALGPDEVPMINYGFQGGQHIWAALQVHNPALDYPQLKVEITVSTCGSGNCDDPNNWNLDTTRELVPDGTTLRVTDEGWFEQIQMVVIVDSYGSGTQGRVEMLVTDPCGRQGYAIAQGTVG